MFAKIFGKVEAKVEAKETKAVASESSGSVTTFNTLQQQIRENKITTLALGQMRVFDAKTEPQELKTLSGHEHSVNAIVVLSDGTVVSSSSDKTIKCWDPKTGKCLATWQGDEGDVSALRVLHDGTVISGSWNNYTIKHWDPKSGKCLATWRGHNNSVNALVVLSDKTVISGSEDKTIKRWDPKTGKCLTTWNGHDKGVYSLAVLDDGTVVSGSGGRYYDEKMNGEFKRWDPKSGKCLATWRGHKNSVNALVVLGDKTMISGSQDHTIKRWDPKTGKCLATWQDYGDSVKALAVLDNGTVVSSFLDSLKHWDPKTGECLTSWWGRHEGGITVLATLADGTLVSGSVDRTLKLWDMKPSRALLLTEILDTLALLKTNRSVLHLNLQETVINDNAIPALIELCIANVTLTSLDLRATAITPAGFSRLAEAIKSRKPELKLQYELRAKIEEERLQKERVSRKRQAKEQTRSRKEAEMKKSKEQLETLQQQIHENKVTTVAFGQMKVFDVKAKPKWLKTCSDDSRVGVYALMGLGDGTVVSGGTADLRRWNPKTGKCLATGGRYTGIINALALLGDGTVISAHRESTIRRWDPMTMTCLAAWFGHGGNVNTLAVLDDGTVVSGSDDKTIKRWDPKTGKCLATWHGHEEGVSALAVLDDGMVVSGSKDHTIKCWDPGTGKCLATWREENEVKALVVLDDGTVVSGARRLKRWDPKTGTCLATWKEYSADALVALSDGTVVSNSLSSLKRWDPKSGICLATWGEHRCLVTALAVLDDETVVSASADSSEGIICWDMNPQRSLLLTEIIDTLTLLKTNRSVTHINLQEIVTTDSPFPLPIRPKTVNDSAIPALIELCTTNTTLTSLDLRNTAIKSVGFNKLYDAIKLRTPPLRLQHAQMVKIEEKAHLQKERELKEQQAKEQERLRQEEKQKQLQALHKNGELGGIDAQLDLASRYETGNDVAKDPQQVLYWYKKAAEQGNDVAQQKLGEIFEKGLAGKKDYAQAYLWYQKAADQGNDDACAGLKSLKDKGYSPPPSSEFKVTPTSDKSPIGPSSPVAKETKTEAKDDMASVVSFDIAFDELKFQKEIDRGGFGVVYQGTWRINKVAIKKLLIKSLSSDALDEFNSESRIMANLRSEYIVQFYGRCLSPTYCLVMQYMPKGSLFNLLHSSEPLDWTVRYRMMTEIASGLAFLHASNIFHRDLKSKNVLLDEHYRTKLCDFGLSKVKKENQSVKIKSDLAGTLQWIAPELFAGATFTEKADIYSLAMTLWEITSRKTPFADVSNSSLIHIWVTQGKREIIPSDTPLKISSLIRCCWHADPIKRPTAMEIVNYLQSDQVEFKAAETVAASDSAHGIQANFDSLRGTSSILGNLRSI